MHRQNRKILKAGNSSLAITLPKPLVDYFALKQGDILEIISNSDIIVRLPKNKKSKEAVQ
jgi:antitoxin component of MazEF toxin-antitoxin module